MSHCGSSGEKKSPPKRMKNCCLSAAAKSRKEAAIFTGTESCSGRRSLRVTYIGRRNGNSINMAIVYPQRASHTTGGATLFRHCCILPYHEEEAGRADISLRGRRHDARAEGLAVTTSPDEAPHHSFE